MEIVIIVVVAVVLLIVAVAKSPVRRQGDAAESEMNAVAPGAHVDKQFQRPRNEGDLL
jgi:hypothetical protein